MDRVIAAYERFHAAITRLHVPHFLELSLTLAQLKTSGVVDGLVHQGLLERVEDTTDRRQVHVRATAASRETLEDFHDLSRTQLRAILARIESEAELATIERAVDLLTDATGSATEEPS
jgi:DNA-binding MarR family transcriptional regulator